jgi:hypothetical protein
MRRQKNYPRETKGAAGGPLHPMQETLFATDVGFGGALQIAMFHGDDFLGVGYKNAVTGSLEATSSLRLLPTQSSAVKTVGGLESKITDTVAEFYREAAK